MMIIMHENATQEEISGVVARIEAGGLGAHLVHGEERTIIGATGDARPVNRDQFLVLPGVDQVVPISRPYKIASREFSPHNTVFPLDGVAIGGPGVVVIAGPCSVESRSLTLEIALAVKEAGAHALRRGWIGQKR